MVGDGVTRIHKSGMERNVSFFFIFQNLEQLVSRPIDFFIAP